MRIRIVPGGEESWGKQEGGVKGYRRGCCGCIILHTPRVFERGNLSWAVEFHFIVKAFFSKDVLWGYDGMGVCDTERSHAGRQEGRLPYQRAFLIKTKSGVKVFFNIKRICPSGHMSLTPLHPGKAADISGTF